MIPVIWLDEHPLCWDQAQLDDVLSDRSWPTGFAFTHHVGFDNAPTEGPAVVVIPARNHVADAHQINEQLQRYSGVLVVLTSDEERVFPVDALSHPNMRIWLQTPGPTDDQAFMFGCGYPPHTRDILSRLGRPSRAPWFLAGQMNNQRRRQCFGNLMGADGGQAIKTAGFTQGLAHRDYANALANAKVAPCPSGPHTIDTFRIWEALEAGALPLVDSQTPEGDASWYVSAVLGEIGPPTLDDWGQFPAKLRSLLEDWPANANRVQARWQHYKRRFAERISDTLRELSGIAPEAQPITVLMPTSPIAAHPSTAIIEQTIDSVRDHLPDAEIIVMCDGVRPEQRNYRDQYERYLNELLWLTAHRWSNVLPVIHDEHLHQVEMTRRALPMVRTPLVLFAEHDTPLVTDEPIDFAGIMTACSTDRADLVRLHHEALVLPDHEHLMLDRLPIDVAGTPLLRTVQWSQRPHVAQLSFYRRILADHFPDTHRGMIEDVMHGVVHSAWRDYGLAGWDRYRLWMYAPQGGNIKRSYTTDGRGADPKWVDS